MLEAQGIDSQSSLSGSVRRSELSVKTRDVTQKEDSYKTPRMRTNPRSKGIALLNDYESEVGLLPSSRKHWNHNQPKANYSERQTKLRHLAFENGKATQFDAPMTQMRQSINKRETAEFNNGGKNLAQIIKNKVGMLNSGRIKIQPPITQSLAFPKVTNQNNKESN